MKISRSSLFVLLSIVLTASAAPALAHVSVNPRRAEAGGKHQLFFVRAPVEKEIPVVELGVEVDEQWRKNGGDINSFQHVSGWNLHVEKDEDGKVARFYWDGGEAPAETFQMFNMSVNLPKEPGKYPFKSWQKYTDGSVVWWNEKPAEGEAGREEGAQVENPYPLVDVRAKEETQQASVLGGGSLQYTSLVIAVVALALSLVSLRNGIKRS
ncbi:MAG: DUF1775 domain-containing protein [Acidobacteria bacterium]|nr:DUF1775 domain-containing protein [Acidobacteriota bacterium]